MKPLNAIEFEQEIAKIEPYSMNLLTNQLKGLPHNRIESSKQSIKANIQDEIRKGKSRNSEQVTAFCILQVEEYRSKWDKILSEIVIPEVTTILNEKIDKENDSLVKVYTDNVSSFYKSACEAGVKTLKTYMKSQKGVRLSKNKEEHEKLLRQARSNAVSVFTDLIKEDSRIYNYKPLTSKIVSEQKNTLIETAKKNFGTNTHLSKDESYFRDFYNNMLRDCDASWKTNYEDPNKNRVDAVINSWVSNKFAEVSKLFDETQTPVDDMAIESLIKSIGDTPYNSYRSEFESFNDFAIYANGVQTLKEKISNKIKNFEKQNSYVLTQMFEEPLETAFLIWQGIAKGELKESQCDVKQKRFRTIASKRIDDAVKLNYIHTSGMKISDSMKTKMIDLRMEKQDFTNLCAVGGWESFMKWLFSLLK